ncbi:MAG: hypothetical protein AAB339_05700, partial [Elusimicrobiota bacterium]
MPASALSMLSRASGVRASFSKTSGGMEVRSGGGGARTGAGAGGAGGFGASARLRLKGSLQKSHQPLPSGLSKP